MPCNGSGKYNYSSIMKTTLIQIEPHDDLTSIKDKMTWSQSPRMLLFFPHGYPLEQSPLTLKLIRRYAESLGARVALITRSRSMRAIAEEQGILCFASAPQAEKRSWPAAKMPVPRGEVKGAEKLVQAKNGLDRQPKAKAVIKIQRLIAYLLLLLLVVFAVIVFVPSAEVIVYPVYNLQKQSYQVRADPAATSVEITGILPAQTLSIEVQGELSANSSGKVVIPKTKAVGQVEIRNLTTRTVILPKGTIVSAGDEEPVEFYLTSEALLPVDPAGSVVVGVEAVLAGEAGNVGGGAITHISGLENVVSIQNPLPTSGGSEQSFPTPTDEDYRKLETQLKNQLLNQCRQKMAAQQLDGVSLIAESVSLGEVVALAQIPKSGEPSDQATLSITTSCIAFTVAEADEEKLAGLVLDETLANGMMPVNSLIDIEWSGDITRGNDGHYFWPESASRSIMPAWDQDKVVRLLSGKPIATATALLESAFPQARDAVIQVTPDWWGFLPILPGRIALEVQGQ